AQRSVVVKIDVYHIAVDFAEDLQRRVETATGLSTKHLDFATPVLDIKAEARLDTENRTVIKADQCSGQIFNITNLFGVSLSVGSEISFSCLEVSTVAQFVE